MSTAETIDSRPIKAAVLLLARGIMAELGLPHPAARDILAVTGARPAQAYARRTALMKMLCSLQSGPGRPRSQPDSELTLQISSRVLRYLMTHPGAVCGAGTKASYSPGFRRFVLQLRARYSTVDLAAFAAASHVPAATLRSWRSAQARPPERGTDATPPDTGPAAMIVRAYVDWRGSFQAFCEHVHHTLGVPWKRSRIAALLERHGLRAPRARTAGARASCGPFQTFFAGAQWVADGTPIAVRVNGQTHRFNLELVVDTHSGAVVGASIRDNEDSRAVTEAFADAVATTGARPRSLLLDQRPCNMSADIDRATGDTAVIYAGRGRPQSKGHVEGAFGLFSQTLPELEITAHSPRELAHALLAKLVQCWARTLNYRPRRKRSGRTRVALYREPEVSDDARRAAAQAISERAARHPRHRRRIGRASATRRFIADALADLSIADPHGYVATALVHHPLEAVLAGIATYRGKRVVGTLPDDADGRYLIGITRRIAELDEGLQIAEALWQTRAAAREHLINWVMETRCSSRRSTDPGDVIAELIDHALAAPTGVERRLLIAAAARAIRQRSDLPHAALYTRAARRIHAAVELSQHERLECVRSLAAELQPIA